MKDAKEWANLIQNDMRDDQSLAEQSRFLIAMIGEIQRDTLFSCFPIPLNEEQASLCKAWAANDRLWTTQETVAINLETFARLILKSHLQVDEVVHMENCDVNDVNPDGIKKPCNCGRIMPTIYGKDPHEA